LRAGENLIAWRDVSAQEQPETVPLSNVSHPEGFQPIEQNFDFDLLTPARLIKKNVSDKVQIARTNPANSGGADASSRSYGCRPAYFA
jgi:hypothetical protein